jgi:hypothetical protein
VTSRRALIVAGIVLVAGVLATATTMQLRAGSRAIDASDAALVRADRPGAIDAARTAAEAVVPGSPYPTWGYRRLETIARDAEIHGDDETSTGAWRAMRAAALSTRGLGVRTGAWLAMANDGIARVGARGWSGPDAARLQSDVRPTEQTLLESLKREDTPPTMTFVLLAFGAASFFGGVARILTRTDAPSWRTARAPVVVAAVGLALYVLACIRG